MSAPVEVHALLYTATCHEILDPIIRELAGQPDKYRVTATSLHPFAALAYWQLRAVPDVQVYSEPTYLERSFLTRGGGRKLLLLVADWDHPAHQPGFQAVKRARRLGIPSLSVQHGAFGVRTDDGTVSGYDFTADRIAVWGDWFRDALVGSGKGEADRIVVTGNPRMDHLPVDHDAAVAKVARTWDLDPERRRGLLAISLHSYLEDEADRANWDADKVVGLVGSMITGMLEGGVEHVIIRPHPAEVYWGTVHLYVNAAQRIGVPVSFSNSLALGQPELFSVISAVDVVTTQTSTVGLYSAAVGTPALSVSTPDITDPCSHPYFDDEHYLQVRESSDGLTEAIAARVADLPSHAAEAAASLDAYAAPWFEPGGATARIVAQIDELTA